MTQCPVAHELDPLEPTMLLDPYPALNRLREQGPVFDLVEALAFPFPGFAAFSLLGFPDEDTDMLKGWSRNRVLLTYGRLSEDEQVATARDVVAMWRYVEEFVVQRSAEPVDDL